MPPIPILETKPHALARKRDMILSNEKPLLPHLQQFRDQEYNSSNLRVIE